MLAILLGGSLLAFFLFNQKGYPYLEEEHLMRLIKENKIQQIQLFVFEDKNEHENSHHLVLEDRKNFFNSGRALFYVIKNK